MRSSNGRTFVDLLGDYVYKMNGMFEVTHSNQLTCTKSMEDASKAWRMLQKHGGCFKSTEDASKARRMLQKHGGCLKSTEERLKSTEAMSTQVRESQLNLNPKFIPQHELNSELIIIRVCRNRTLYAVPKFICAVYRFFLE